MMKSKPLKHITRITSDVFFRQNMILLGGSLVVALLNYAFYPLLSRLIEPSGFGEVQVFISLTLQFGIFLAAFSLTAAGIRLDSKNNNHTDEVIQELESFARLLVLVAAFPIVLFSKQLQSYFHFQSFIPFLVLIVTTYLSVPITFRNALLQSKHNFAHLSFSGILASISRIIGAVVLAKFGFSTNGVLFGIVISYALLLWYLEYVSSRYNEKHLKIFDVPRIPNINILKPYLPGLGVVLSVTFCSTLFFNLDTLSAKHYHDPYWAGLYTGISVLASLIFFAITPLALVLYASLQPSLQPSEARRQLLKSLRLYAVICILGLLVLGLLKNSIAQLILGSEYLQLSGLLPLAAVTVCSISSVYLFAFYSLAMRLTKTALLTLGGLLFTLLSISLRHGSFQSILTSILCGSILTALCLGWNIMRDKSYPTSI